MSFLRLAIPGETCRSNSLFYFASSLPPLSVLKKNLPSRPWLDDYFETFICHPLVFCLSDKIVVLASTPHLWLIWPLYVVKQSKVRLGNKFGLASQEPCCSWLASPSPGILGQGPSSFQDYLSWGCFIQNSLTQHQLPQSKQSKQGTDKLLGVDRYLFVGKSIWFGNQFVGVMSWFCMSFCVASLQTWFCRLSCSCG